MDLMEQLLCPQVCMDVEDTPIEIHAPIDAPEGPEEAEPSSLPIDLRVRLILDDEFQFQPEQIPHELLECEKNCFPEGFSEEVYLKGAKLNCTVCNRHIGTSLVEQVVRYIHPELNTLMCHPCYKFYGTGEFEKDEDGSELYCKWCGQGGNVICCSDCSLVFCQSCVKRNLGVQGLTKIKNADVWCCFKCDPKQLAKFHIACHVLHEYSTKQLEIAVRSKNIFLVTDDLATCCTKQRKRRKSVTSDDENDEFHPEKAAGKPRSKSKKGPTSQWNKDGGILKPAAKVVKRALATLNSATQNNNIVSSGVYQNLQTTLVPSQSLSQPPLIKFSVAPGAHTASDSNIPTLADLLPSLFSLATPVGVSGALVPQQTAASTAALGANLNQSNASNVSIPHVTKKNVWLLNTINACKFHAQALIAEADSIQKSLKDTSSGMELAELHNRLQREMSACTNRLVLCRKTMHKEFLGYLNSNNISHSSHTKAPTSASTGVRALQPAKRRTLAPNVPPLRPLSAAAQARPTAIRTGAAPTTRPVITAAIDLCDDDEDGADDSDDCMLDERERNEPTTNGTSDDPLAVSDDDDDDDDGMVGGGLLEPTVILETSESGILDLTDCDPSQAPPTEDQVTPSKSPPPNKENKSPLSDTEYKRAVNVKVVLDRDMCLDSTKYLTKNKLNRVVPDLVRDNDDVLSSLELVGITLPRNETRRSSEDTREEDGAEEEKNSTDAAQSSASFDFIREMQNEMSQSTSLLGVDIVAPAAPSTDVGTPLVSEVSTDAKTDADAVVDQPAIMDVDMAEVHVLEAIKQLTEIAGSQMAQDIDSNDNVRSEGEEVGVGKVADAQAEAADIGLQKVADIQTESVDMGVGKAPDVGAELVEVGVEKVAELTTAFDGVCVLKVAEVTQTNEAKPTEAEVPSVASESKNMDVEIAAEAEPLATIADVADSIPDNISFDDATPPAICLEDMVKIYEACDTTIDGDMVPPDE